MKNNWLLEALQIYRQKPVVVIGLLGFAAGLPLLLVFSTLTAWLSDVGVERSAIGFFAWVGITYSVKFFWSPVVDRLRLPGLSKLGQRRSWILLGQLGIALGLVWMSQLDPLGSLVVLAGAALLVAFASATQDVALDAFRIESAAEELQAALAAAYVFGYRLALLVAGAGALYLAEFGSWQLAYLSMAGLMLLGMLALLWADEPTTTVRTSLEADELARVDALMGRPMNLHLATSWQRWITLAVLCPVLEFFQRNGKFALVILLFIGVFRLSDLAMGIMANPFYWDLGYSKTEIANVAKLFGFGMTIFGSALCGVLVVKYGILRPLLLGAVLVASTNLLFVVLAFMGVNSKPPVWGLALVISADNVSGGLASTAFIAYLSSLANRYYTATQYALFSSLMSLPGKFISGFSGLVVDAQGYAVFFLVAAALGLPAIILVLVLMRRQRHQPQLQAQPTG